MSNQMEPGTPDYDHLAEETLRLYTEGFRSTPEAAQRSFKALLVWELLTELDLAVPPEWVAAVWHTQDVERENTKVDG